MELNWSDSCFREAYSDRNPLLTGEGKGQTKVSCTITLTQQNKLWWKLHPGWSAHQISLLISRSPYKQWKLLVRQAVNSKLWQSSLWSSEQLYRWFAFCLSHRDVTLFWNQKLINSAKPYLMKNIIKGLQGFLTEKVHKAFLNVNFFIIIFKGKTTLVQFWH